MSRQRGHTIQVVLNEFAQEYQTVKQVIYACIESLRSQARQCLVELDTNSLLIQCTDNRVNHLQPHNRY